MSVSFSWISTCPGPARRMPWTVKSFAVTSAPPFASAAATFSWSTWVTCDACAYPVVATTARGAARISVRVIRAPVLQFPRDFPRLVETLDAIAIRAPIFFRQQRRDRHANDIHHEPSIAGGPLLEHARLHRASDLRDDADRMDLVIADR